MLVISISVLVSLRVQRILKAMHECIKDVFGVEGAELSLARCGILQCNQLRAIVSKGYIASAL